ncbi:TNF receptor-associated factor family protein DDB_G0272098-like [Zingiber officinale]|uniref:Uncharacterized protein n=1 Tax=Zingiber officinale TaxID=94328 RepID=A0A8J5G421_ZINOF|nr:TNF receptor-associated factor family protein DDB_G0272098-like [Zingiber officinale]XP_042398957.1 TNF receptor-associated factor family protein DDB_G0272098-like [Zingiber officinale]KAG6497669.1 hypothetical protein ZIOFF_045573 [Zingiber officinale]
MFQQSSSRNSHNKESKVKRGIQITLLLVVAIWLLNQFSKNEYTETVHINFDPEEDIDFGRKVKAGSENVIIIDGQKSDFDETGGDQVEAFGQYNEEKNENESFSKEKEESQEDILNTSHTEINEQLNSKDESDYLRNNKDVIRGTTNDKDDVLELPGQTDSVSSMDQNEGKHAEDNSDHGNELVTLDRAKEDTIKEITSQEERLLSSKDQSDGRVNTEKVEKETINLNEEVNLETEGSSYASSEVDKESVDPHEDVKLEAEINSENNSEVESETVDIHGETKLETEGNGENNSEVEKELIDADAENKLETEGNSDSNSEVEKETIDTHGETKLETEGSSENNSEVGNETIETLGETKLETEGSSENNPEVANETIETLGETKLETDSSRGNGSEVEKETIGSQGEVELGTVGNSENSLDDTTDIANTHDGSISLPKEESEVSTDKESIDAVQFLDEHASDGVKNDAEEKEDSKSNEDALESKLDSISEDQNAGTESGKSSDNNENLENPSMKNNAEEEKVNSKSNQDAFESKGDITSEDQNAGNENGNSSNNNDNLENSAVEGGNFSTQKNTGDTIFEDTTEPKPKEETISEFGNDNASTGRNVNPESSSQGAKDTE